MSARLKQFFLFFSFTLIPYVAYSQSPLRILAMDSTKSVLLDYADYSITYNICFVIDAANPNETVNHEHILLIGNNYSKFINKDFTRRIVFGGGTPGIDGRGLAGTIIYKELNDNLMTVITVVLGPTSKSRFRYTDNIPVMTWKIENEKKMIQGYLCQKATTRFLGRDYIAWFTLDIPLSNGPWKFGGLPGLILQVSDTRNHYVFEATRIDGFSQRSYMPEEGNVETQSFLKTVVPPLLSSNRQPIVLYDKIYTDTTRSYLFSLIKKMHTDFEEYVNYRGMHAEGVEGVTFPYNPIELE